MAEGDRPQGADPSDPSESAEPSPWWTPGPPDPPPPSAQPLRPQPDYGYGQGWAPPPDGQPTVSLPPYQGGYEGGYEPGYQPGYQPPLTGGHLGSPPRGPDYLPPAAYPSTSPSYGAPVLPPAETQARQRPPFRGTPLLVVALLAALLGGAIGAISGVAYEHGHVNKSSPSSSDLSSGPPLTTGSPTPVDPNPESVAQIAAKLLPSVVTLNVSGSTESGTGSGVIIRADGYILTNNHVVAVAANGGTITADFYKGKQKVPARIVGRDPKTDLAVVRVDATNLPAATLGQSSSLVVGDPVVALGAPLGLSSTVTSGIVSALDRNVDVPDETGGSSGGLLIGAIQTDAAINPGNSGGPLVDDKAQVIGINSAIAAAPGATGSTGGNIGVGFAIPIDYARSIADEIIRTGKATHPYVGVTAGPDTTGNSNGAKIISVVPGGPADKAGLRSDDVITEVQGKTIDGVDGLVAATRLHQVGDVVTITYLRDGQSHTVQVTLQESRS
jgi:putative serine protease PepD